jgi:CrcB protein
MRNPVESIEVPLAVAVGGAMGALARWGLASAIVTGAVPLATFITNIVGCFALGVVLVVGEVLGHRQGHHHHHQRWWVRLWRPFAATGVLGGFTTFSTFVVEIDRLAVGMAVGYLVASVVLGLLAYSAGNALARTTFGVRS